MGAHSTFEDHLKGVQAFHSPRADDELDRNVKKKDSKKALKESKSSKHKDSGKHQKEKRKGKEKDRKKKVNKDRKKQDVRNSDQSSSDEDIDTQLEKGRAAVRITRDILGQNPGLKQELRQLLWHIDQGEAVQISGIPDPWLRDQLQQLFGNLSLASSSKGIFVKKQGASPCLQLLGHVISEARAQLISHSTPAGSTQIVTDAQPSNGPAQPASDPALQLKAQQEQESMEAAFPHLNGHIADAMHGESAGEPPPGGIASDTVIVTTAEHPAAELDMAEAELESEPLPAVAGPAMPPGWASQDPPGSPVPEQEGVADSDQEDAAAAQRRAAGPARPPPELLAAAAEVHQAMMDELEDYDELIGPAPPDLVDEIEAAGDDDRAKEVVRIIRHLGASKEADAYTIMGVEAGAKNVDVKKRYMRLSLLIHPDKCSHPRAQTAFQAVSKASKELQDPERRKALDGAREEARLREMATQAAAQEERERQWRVARGTATAEDLKGPIRVGPAQRDTWMTDLPEERRAAAAPSQVSVTTFSQKGIQQRGDTRGWTETPQQKLLRLSAAEQQRPAQLEAARGPDTSAAAAAVDAYNSSVRAKTLVERHQEKLKEEKRQKKKRKADEKHRTQADSSVAGSSDDGWNPELHPWRPFDREKDLNMGPQMADKDQMMKQAGNLTSRFGSNSGQRNFL